jgi:hypothetical protein
LVAGKISKLIARTNHIRKCRIFNGILLESLFYRLTLQAATRAA